jgi:hypothetical protein
MRSAAPLRELSGRLIVLPRLSEQYRNPDPRARLTPFDRMLRDAADELAETDPQMKTRVSKIKQAELDYKSDVHAAFLELIDETAKMAEKLGQLLRGEVPHPADEQSKVRMMVARIRGSFVKGTPMPTIDEIMPHVGRLWTLADALGEPTTFEPGAGARGRRGSRRRREAIDAQQVARALLAIKEGTHTSTRKIGKLIGATQSSVYRNAIIKEAIRTWSRAPRHRGFRTKGGGVEAVGHDG